MKLDTILTKYWDIIKEEVNVKEIGDLSSEWLSIKKVFKPIWSQISSKFGKDTWNIIRYWKMWHIEELEDWNIKVFDDFGHEWVLIKEDYEVVYEWLEGDDKTIDGDIIAKLSLEITPELEREGIAREISRFLNQMRKEADYVVDKKVVMFYDTQHQEYIDVINEFKDFLSSEALLLDIVSEKKEWDIVSLFTLAEKNITFSLKQ